MRGMGRVRHRRGSESEGGAIAGVLKRYETMEKERKRERERERERERKRERERSDRQRMEEDKERNTRSVHHILRLGHAGGLPHRHNAQSLSGGRLSEIRGIEAAVPAAVEQQSRREQTHERASGAFLSSLRSSSLPLSLAGGRISEVKGIEATAPAAVKQQSRSEQTRESVRNVSNIHSLVSLLFLSLSLSLSLPLSADFPDAPASCSVSTFPGRDESSATVCTKVARAFW